MMFLSSETIIMSTSLCSSCTINAPNIIKHQEDHHITFVATGYIVHQQHDQYLFCQGWFHQSSDSRSIHSGIFHNIGTHQSPSLLRDFMSLFTLQQLIRPNIPKQSFSPFTNPFILRKTSSLKTNIRIL
mmetsp:Transcript_20537/g.44573  ORF Transcript_20537/g.44573 Transcript_20537/m.44573 type:complete len:129 (-) Transcript_20537:1371-1757(-)